MQKIKWGIIGCGDVAERKSGPAFQKINNSELMAVMRRNAEKAEDFAKRHHVPKWYSKADQLINDPDINSIYIATPPNTHEEYAIAALAAGKNVYLEKPMALDSKSAARILEKEKSSNGRLIIAHYRRELPAFKKVKELLENGSIGRPLFVDLKVVQPLNSDIIAASEENWRLKPEISGGGLFHDLAPHQLDLMLTYFGNIKTAKGMAQNQSRITDADDLVSGIIHFQNGVVFNGLWYFTSIDTNLDRCEITGTEGKISFAFFGKQELTLTQGKNEQEFKFEEQTYVQQPMIEKVVGYLSGKNENPCTAEEAVEVMEILDVFTGQ